MTQLLVGLLTLAGQMERAAPAWAVAVAKGWLVGRPSVVDLGSRKLTQ